MPAFDRPTLDAQRRTESPMKILAALELPIMITPIPLIEAAVRTMLDRVLVRHPALFDRLGDHGNACFCFSPTDLPLRFFIKPAARSVTVRRKHAAHPCDAMVEASLADLLGLLQGSSDADALFFSRSVTVTGDMEAALALRNALDDVGIDLVDDVVGKESPLRPFARALMTHLMPGTESRAWN